MPLIVICGQPCSGKSTVVTHIAESCKAKNVDFVIVNEDSLHLLRDASYKDVPSEKNTRGLLRSATDRALTRRSSVVILDSLNNIKGYRYELWCLARGAATRYSVVHVATSVETCWQWNAQRSGDTYGKGVFDDLAGRFERPDSRNRWDSPLFTAHPVQGEAHIKQIADAVVLSVTAELSAVMNREAISAGSSQATSRLLKPTCATSNAKLAATNTLHDIDKSTQEVLDLIIEAQAASGAASPGIIRFGDDLPTLNLQRQVPLQELRRHKRTFLKLATNSTFTRVTDASTIRRIFIDYLRDKTSSLG